MKALPALVTCFTTACYISRCRIECHSGCNCLSSHKHPPSANRILFWTAVSRGHVQKEILTLKARRCSGLENTCIWVYIYDTNTYIDVNQCCPKPWMTWGPLSKLQISLNSNDAVSCIHAADLCFLEYQTPDTWGKKFFILLPKLNISRRWTWWGKIYQCRIDMFSNNVQCSRTIVHTKAKDFRREGGW